MTSTASFIGPIFWVCCSVAACSSNNTPQKDEQDLAAPCTGNNAQQLYNEGLAISQQDSPNYSLATDCHERACAQGHFEACVQAALSHLRGRGRSRDFSKGKTFAEKACAGDRGEGCWLIALMHWNGDDGTQDRAQGIKMAIKACETGYIEACDFVGEKILKDSKRDPKRAAKFFTIACNADYPPSCYSLGILNSEGVLTHSKPEKAVTFLRKSCDGEYPDACFTLGNLMLKGRGTKKDAEAGRILISQACAGGYEDACTWMSAYEKKVCADPKSPACLKIRATEQR